MTNNILEDLRKNSEDISNLSKRFEETGRQNYQIQKGGLAYRMMVELVVGMVLGIGIGYGVDYVLNTFPIFLIIFSLLGFAAGIRVMLQTAKQIKFENEKEEKS